MAKKKKVLPNKKAPKKAAAKKAAKKPTAPPAEHSKVKKRPVQGRVPGMEQERDRVLEDLAKKYQHAHDTELQWARDAKDLKQRAQERMKQLKVTVYRSQDAEIEVELVASKEDVKVRQPKKDADDLLVPR